MFIDDALSTNVQERPTCMTFPNPRETEPVLELEKRTSRLYERWLDSKRV